MISKDGAPVYQQLECSRFLSASENLLALIQAATLRDILVKHGWWTGLERSVSLDVAGIPHPSMQEKQYPASIARFKRILFDDRSLLLASLLEQYWQSQAMQREGVFICGVPDFSAVWEHMLKSTVDDVSAKWNAKLPLPSYVRSDRTIQARAKGGVMDIVLESTDSLTVADAKYYRAQSAATAPGIADLLKQSFYSRSLKTLGEGRNVRSLFVFPAWGVAGPLESGKFFLRDSEETPDWLDSVECIYVDARELMKN